MYRNPIRFRPSSILPSVLGFIAAFTGARAAWAGEIVVGKEPLPVDDKGRITAEGRKKAVKELHSAPGEELWTIHIWASLDRGAPGPLYIEFWDKWQGKDVKVPWAYEDRNYDGGKYYSTSFELEGNVGFNVGHTYRLRAVQVNEKGKDVILAKGAKVTLIKTPAPENESEDESSESEEENDEAYLPPELQGDDEPAEASGASTEPPETEASKKKGCGVHGRDEGAAVALLLGLGLAGMGRRRRRS